MSNFIFEYYSEDGLTAYASCRFCGSFKGKASSTGKDDIAAMTDAISEVRQHQLSCGDNPERKVTEMDAWLARIKK